MMYALTKYKTGWFVLVMFCLSACAPAITSQAVTVTPTPILSTAEVTGPTATATATPLPTNTVTPAPTTPVTPENTVTPATPLATDTPQSTMETLLMDGCPEMVGTNQQTLWSTGSILLGTGLLVNHGLNADSFQPQEPGIWAVSAHHMEPQLAYAIPASSNSWASLSGDGNTLVHIINAPNYIKSEARDVVFFDMRSQTEIRLAGGPGSGSVLNREWLADGRIKFMVDEERIWRVGVWREYLLLDSETKQSETLIEELSLPDYQFNDEPRPHGYASVSPSGEFVLYSANVETGVEIRLLNLITGEIIWQQKSQYLPGPYHPEWTKDTSHVLFYLGDFLEGAIYTKIVLLGSDGQPEELPQQPYPQLYQSTFIDGLTASPDQRYIIYRAGWQEKAAFVVDTTASQTGEICAPGATFIDGQWIADDLFVYRMSLEINGQLTHSLRVLDVPAWTTQIIFEAEPGYGVNIFGWTPVEFSQP
jgi:hypothetical protein